VASIRALDIMDIARALGQRPFQATPRSVADWLATNYVGTGGGSFDYNTAIATTHDAFRGLHSRESAIAFCKGHGNPKGRAQNASAIAAVMPYALEHKSICHRIGLTAVSVGRFAGRTVYAKIKAPLLRIENEEAFVVMPGYRMTFRPLEIEIDFACSVALATFAQDDRSGADFEYLYAGPSPQSSKIRMFQAIRGQDRFRFSEDQINRLLDVFVKGVALAHEEGLDRTEPHLHGYKIVDPREPLFPW
jgi:hypothetical protein